MATDACIHTSIWPHDVCHRKLKSMILIVDFIFVLINPSHPQNRISHILWSNSDHGWLQWDPSQILVYRDFWKLLRHFPIGTDDQVIDIMVIFIGLMMKEVLSYGTSAYDKSKTNLEFISMFFSAFAATYDGMGTRILNLSHWKNS